MMNEDDFRLLGDVVAGVAQHVDRLVQAARGDEDEVAIERRSNPDRQLAGCQRRDDCAQHPGRLQIVRLITIPQRGPCVLRYVLAPYRMVNDHRTGIKDSAVDEALDGDLDRFMIARLLQLAGDPSAAPLPPAGGADEDDI